MNIIIRRCDYANYGLTTEARSQISPARGTTARGKNSINLVQEVGIMYPSDYNKYSRRRQDSSIPLKRVEESANVNRQAFLI